MIAGELNRSMNKLTTKITVAATRKTISKQFDFSLSCSLNSTFLFVYFLYTSNTALEDEVWLKKGLFRLNKT